MWFIEKLCILCLQNNVNLKSIHAKDANNVFIIEKLTYAIAALDNTLNIYPMHICERCDKLLSTMYAYKQQCVKHINYIRNYVLQVNPSHTNTSHLSVPLYKNNKTESDENEIHSGDINENLVYIKTEDEINIDHDLFEEQIQTSNLKNEVVNEIDNNESFESPNSLLEIQLIEENITNIHTEDVNNTDICRRNVETEVDNGSFIEICEDVSDRNERELLKCVTCENEFKNKRELTVHMELHKQEKSYNCNVCKKVFKRRDGLVRHLRIHTGERPFQCNICKKLFNQSNILKKHLRIHSGEKPFECNICNKAFNYSNNLKTHMRLHTGERPFGCTMCNKAFNEANTLKNHMRVHTNEKPFKCDTCLKTFSVIGNLRRHMNIHKKEAV